MRRRPKPLRPVRNNLVFLGIYTALGSPRESGLGAVPARTRDFQAAVDQAVAYAQPAGASALQAITGAVAPDAKTEAPATVAQVGASNVRIVFDVYHVGAEGCPDPLRTASAGDRPCADCGCYEPGGARLERDRLCGRGRGADRPGYRNWVGRECKSTATQTRACDGSSLGC
jgi:hypothetical protein